MRRTATAALICLAATTTMRADVLHDTEDPFGGFLGLWGMDVSTSQTAGARFTVPDADHVLDEVGVWLMNNSGSVQPAVRVTIREDAGDVPADTAIAQWTFQIQALGWNPVFERLDGDGTLILEAGRSYWIVGASNAPGGSNAVWNFASQGVGFSANTNNGTWQPGGEGAALTLTVLGTPTASCPADENSDGTVDVLDLLEYLELFLIADPGADRTGEGDVTVLDLLTVLSGWFDAVGDC